MASQPFDRSIRMTKAACDAGTATPHMKQNATAQIRRMLRLVLFGCKEELSFATHLKKKQSIDYIKQLQLLLWRYFLVYGRSIER